MTPGHNGDPQQTKPPYTMSLSRSTVEPGGSTTVNLQSLGDVRFIGFLCAASALSDDSNHTLGEFSLPSAFSNQAQLLTCTQSTANTAITHVDNTPKSNIHFDWTVPADASIGSVFKIRCTFVKSFYQCWTNNILLVTVVKQDQNIVTGNTTSKLTTTQSSVESTAKGNIESSNSSKTVLNTSTSHGNTEQGHSTGEGSLPQFGDNDLTNETNFNNVSPVYESSQNDSNNMADLNKLIDFFLSFKINSLNDSQNPEDFEKSSQTGSSMTLNNSTESTIATLSSLNFNYSFEITTKAQNNSQSISLNIFPDQAQNKSLHTSNIQKNVTGHLSTPIANTVPDFISSDPNAYFLTSGNIRHHLSNARRIQRNKGGKGCIISI
ncbi:hypothetical protein Btru_042774 [Bulinus truncatus]|nr:hypothetical protein Btru_042774 [Bulinus truncatus]